MITKEQRTKIANELSAHFVDRGLLIEAGWMALKEMALNPNAPETQISEMRMAFFAGAQHLLGSIMGFLGEGGEPTPQELKRMDNIHDELEKFGEELKARFNRKGN